MLSRVVVPAEREKSPKTVPKTEVKQTEPSMGYVAASEKIG